MKVYLSIPISGRDIEQVKAELDEAKKAITAKGWEPVSPLDGVTDYEKPWIDYIIEDLKILNECDAICRIWVEEYGRSRGCDIEFTVARHKNLIYIGYDLAEHKICDSGKAMDRQRKEAWKNVCDGYLFAFCIKHDFDYESYAWVGNNAGTTVQIADYFVGMNEIRYDVDHDVPEEKFIQWYDYDLLIRELELPRHINYESWCKGAPLPYSEEDIERARQYQARISEAQREFEKFIREMEVKR